MNNLYYISQGESSELHLEHIKTVCEAGVKWVQLRMKHTSLQSYIETAKKAKEICNRNGAKLFINDNVVVAKLVDAYGLHLGKGDIEPSEARAVLGKKWIGGTANSLDDCLWLVAQGVDYIGLGPFRFTTTKKNLSGVLGLDGYKDIIRGLSEMDVKLPIWAIGGIRLQDVEAIMKMGFKGVAVSGLLTGKSPSELNETVLEIMAINNK